MKLLRTVLHIVPALLLVLTAHALPVQETNMERLKYCARLLSDSLTLQYNTGDTVCFTIAAHPASWLLDGSFIAAADSRGVRTVECSAPVTRSGVAPAITAIGIEYRHTDNSDLIQRTAYLKLSIGYTARSGSELLRSSGDMQITLLDTLEADRLSAMDDPNYAFAKGIMISDQRPGFWEKIVEPAVVVGSAAVIVILLFTVRSQ